MGTTSPAERLLLAEERQVRQIISEGAHHRCLGSRRTLPYSAPRGQKSVNRQNLDALKRDIPLLGYLQALRNNQFRVTHYPETETGRLPLQPRRRNAPA